MPKQSELQNVKVSMERELATPRYLYPFFDRNFNTRYFVLDLGEEKVVMIDAAMMTKIGEDINFRVTGSDVTMLESVSPVIFYGTLHSDPWGVLERLRGPEEIRKGLRLSNLFGRKVGGSKLSDIKFSENLMAATAFELKSMGFLKKEVPVGDVLFNQDGSLGLKQH